MKLSNSTLMKANSIQKYGRPNEATPAKWQAGYTDFNAPISSEVNGTINAPPVQEKTDPEDVAMAPPIPPTGIEAKVKEEAPAMDGGKKGSRGTAKGKTKAQTKSERSMMTRLQRRKPRGNAKSRNGRRKRPTGRARVRKKRASRSQLGGFTNACENQMNHSVATVEPCVANMNVPSNQSIW